MKLMSVLWKMAAHWKGAPCSRWQVVQWQYLAASGSFRDSWYRVLPQWHLPVHAVGNSDPDRWIWYGGRCFHASWSEWDVDVSPFSWLLVDWLVGLGARSGSWCEDMAAKGRVADMEVDDIALIGLW